MDRLESSGGCDTQQAPLLSSFGAASGSGVQLQRDSVREDPSSEEAVLSQGPQGILTTKSTVVQLRRSTNKQGRQAPTPPRRTRYLIENGQSKIVNFYHDIKPMIIHTFNHDHFTYIAAHFVIVHMEKEVTAVRIIIQVEYHIKATKMVREQLNQLIVENKM